MGIGIQLCYIAVLYLQLLKSYFVSEYARDESWLCRCMMHAFNTCMGSLLGHAWAKNIVKRNQKMVTSIRASHMPLTELGKIANRMGIAGMLITSTRPRFTPVHASLESVVRLQPA